MELKEICQYLAAGVLIAFAVNILSDLIVVGHEARTEMHRTNAPRP